MTVKVRCPYCNIMGLDYVQTAELDSEIKVVFCSQCGAIHGVIGGAAKRLPPKSLLNRVLTPKTEPPPKIIAQPNITVNKPVAQPKSPHQQKYQAILEQAGRADLIQKRQEYEKELQQRAMSVQKGSTHYLQVALDDGPPYCFNCKVDMKPATIPHGYPNTGCNIWLCPNLCGEWEADSSVIFSESRAIQPTISIDKTLPKFEPRIIEPRPIVFESDPQIHHPAFTVPELAYILKRVLNQPVQLTDDQATQMLVHAHEKTNPAFVCQLHKYKLVKMIIPKGFPHAQKIFWACPKYRGCHHWFWLGQTQPALDPTLVVELPHNAPPTPPCPKCNYRLRKMSIPQGYADAGQMIWVCANCQYHAKVN